jgi:hypothetical protein
VLVRIAKCNGEEDNLIYRLPTATKKRKDKNAPTNREDDGGGFRII